DSGRTVLQGHGDGTFPTALTTATGSRPLDLTVGDFNGDGRPDLAAADQTTDDVAVLLGQGAGLFPNFRHLPTVAEGPAFVAVTADFNGDGAPDLATANADFGTVSVLLGGKDGAFHNAGQFAAGLDPTA